MNIIKLWLMSVAGALITTSLLKILTSDTKIKKIINIFMSIFILFYTVSPVWKYIKNNDFFSHKYQYEQKNNNVESLYKESYESIIINSIKKICNEKNVQINNIKIDSELSEDGYLIVKSLNLDVSNCDNTEILKKQIKDSLGFEVIVIE